MIVGGNRRWSEQDDNILKDYALRGWSARRCAFSMGRDYAAMLPRYRKCCEDNDIPVRLSDEDDQAIKTALPIAQDQREMEYGKGQKPSAFSVEQRRDGIHPMFRAVMYREGS
jgi:hypothetical protein